MYSRFLFSGLYVGYIYQHILYIMLESWLITQQYMYIYLYNVQYIHKLSTYINLATGCSMAHVALLHHI